MGISVREMNVPVENEQERQQVLQEINRTIFRPVETDPRWLKWIKDKVIAWLNKNDENYKRFFKIHRKVKQKFMHPLLRYIAKKLGKYLVSGPEDIPEVWNNNLIRMFHWSLEQGLDDMWIQMHYVAGLPDGRYIKKVKENLKLDRIPTPQEYLEEIKKIHRESDYHRRLIFNIFMTEVLEDTIDREWVNMSIMNMTHAMMEFWGVSLEERNKVPRPGQFPVYLTNVATNPEYFIKNMKMPIWQNPGYDRYKKSELRNNGNR